MTQQEMENIIQELETTFKQPVNEKPWRTDGLAFGRYINEVANYETKQFEVRYGVALWFNNVVVSTITSVAQWDAFKSVARLFCQDNDTHYGECIYCHRVSILNRFNSCEACELEARLDDC